MRAAGIGAGNNGRRGQTLFPPLHPSVLLPPPIVRLLGDLVRPTCVADLGAPVLLYSPTCLRTCFFPTAEHPDYVSIRAVVENDLVRLPSGIHLPDGTQVRLEVLPRFNSTTGWPDGYFKETAGVLEGEPFDRPTQGELPQTVSW